MTAKKTKQSNETVSYNVPAVTDHGAVFPIDLFNSCILSQAVQMALWNTAFSLLIK